MSGYDDYLRVLRGCFTKVCVAERQHLSVEFEHWLVEAYMAVIDSLTVELIYGNDDGYRRRIEAFSGLYVWASQAATDKNR